MNETIAGFSKALAHPVRLAILRYFAESHVCVCGDLVDRLPLAQSTVSQHLKVLKEAGLIQGTIVPPRTCYCIDWKGVEEAAVGFSRLFEGMAAHRNMVETKNITYENHIG